MKKCCNNCAYMGKAGTFNMAMCLRELTLEEDHITGNIEVMTSNIVECILRKSDFLSGKCGYKANEMKCTECLHSTKIRGSVPRTRERIMILYCNKKENFCHNCYTNVNNCDNCYETKKKTFVTIIIQTLMDVTIAMKQNQLWGKYSNA